MVLIGAAPMMLIGAILSVASESWGYAAVLGPSASQGMVIGYTVWWKRGRLASGGIAGFLTGVAVTVGLVALAWVNLSVCGPYDDLCGLWVFIPIIFGPAAIVVGLFWGVILSAIYRRTAGGGGLTD